MNSNLLNDGSGDAPKLRVFLNLDTLVDLPSSTIWDGSEGSARLCRLSADGFEGVQLTSDAAPLGGTLPCCGLDRINTPDEADAITAKHSARGDLCFTVH